MVIYQSALSAMDFKFTVNIAVFIFESYLKIQRHDQQLIFAQHFNTLRLLISNQW